MARNLTKKLSSSIFKICLSGRILKIVNTADQTNLRASRPSLIEEIALFPPDTPIEKIHIETVGSGLANDRKKPKLVVLTRDQVFSSSFLPTLYLTFCQGYKTDLITFLCIQVVSIPVSRCSIIAQSCSVCVALQDPYCAWNTHEQKCSDLYDFEEDQIDSNTFLQVKHFKNFT